MGKIQRELENSFRSSKEQPAKEAFTPLQSKAFIYDKGENDFLAWRTTPVLINELLSQTLFRKQPLKVTYHKQVKKKR